jgi:multiple sugar transport system substrate-binding protein
MNPIIGADNLGVMACPVVTPGAVPSLAFDGGVGYGVAKWTKDPALAADLVRSLTSTDALTAYSSDAGAIASDKTVTIAGGGPAAAAIAAAIPKGKPALHVALSAKTQDVMGRVSQQLLSGSITVDDGMKQLAAADQAG